MCKTWLCRALAPHAKRVEESYGLAALQRSMIACDCDPATYDVAQRVFCFCCYYTVLSLSVGLRFCWISLVQFHAHRTILPRMFEQGAFVGILRIRELPTPAGEQAFGAAGHHTELAAEKLDSNHGLCTSTSPLKLQLCPDSRCHRLRPSRRSAGQRLTRCTVWPKGRNHVRKPGFVLVRAA